MQYLFWVWQHYRKAVIGGGVGVSMLALGAVGWYIPSLHTSTIAYAKLARSWFVSDQTEVAKQDPSDNKVAQLVERVGDLEKQVLAQDKEMRALQDSTLSLESQFKDAVAEVAKSNDQLQKQYDQWVTLAKQAQQGSTPPLPIGENSADTSPVLSTKGEEKTRLVNLNTATADELDTLPGIGPVIAGRIVTYREEKGQFKHISDLQKVSGIGPSLYDKVKDLVEV